MCVCVGLCVYIYSEFNFSVNHPAKEFYILMYILSTVKCDGLPASNSFYLDLNSGELVPALITLWG